MSSAHNAPFPSMSAAVGGSFAELSAGAAPGNIIGGAIRGVIKDFTPASRRRLMRLVNSVNRDEAGLPFFVTLTYHNVWPESREGRKKHLDALQKRMERAYGAFAAVWRLEFQRRGAPHYHLLVFLDPEQIVPSYGEGRRRHRRSALLRLRNNIAWMWNEIVDADDIQHLEAGTAVEEIRSWNGVNSYAAKYMGKLETLQKGLEPPGRFWGVWRKKMLPISYEHTQITLPHFFQMRRVLRRYGKMRLRNTREHRRVSCFVSHQTTNRLLEFYGYYPDGRSIDAAGGAPTRT